MFSKLLKYELKSVGKWYFALNASVIGISFFLGFSIRSLEAYAQNQSGINSAHFAQLIPIILALIFGVLVAGAWIATLVIIIRQFYKNVFGREGYLTLTLPVSSHQLILSKLLASFIWTVFNAIVLVIGITLLVLPISGVGRFLMALPYFASLFTPTEWLIIFICFILSSLSGILMIYLSIAVGQLFTDRRAIMGFVAYFAIAIIVIILSETIGGQLTQETLDINLFIYSSIECLIKGTVFYFATNYLLKNKLNIQ